MIKDSKRFKKYILFFIKAVFSVGLLWYLVNRTDLGLVKQEFSRVGILPFVAAVGLYLLAQLVSSFRWRFLLPSSVSVGNLFSLYLVGGFFNNFLPTMMGGDAVKAYFLYRKIGSGPKALASVFMDRYLGFVGLMVVATASAVVGSKWLIDTPIVEMLVILGLFLVLGSVFLWTVRWDWLGIVRSLYRPLMAYKGDYRVMAKCVAVSLGVQAVAITGVMVIGRGLEIDLPWYIYFVFVPLVVAASMAPVSVSGFGVREGAMVYLFGLAGVAEHKALSLSLIWYFSVMTGNMLGAVEYLRMGQADKKAVAEIGEEEAECGAEEAKPEEDR